MLIDTHCHIHEADYPLDRTQTLDRARQAGVQKLICVGTSLASSTDAVKFAKENSGVFASVGVHPHETKDGFEGIEKLLKHQTEHLPAGNGFAPGLARAPAPGQPRAADVSLPEEAQSDSNTKIVAIGEVGLDYFYSHSPRAVQIKALEFQLQLAIDNNLPVIFHVREAFDDFWPIFDNFSRLQGVLHSFTDTQNTLEQALRRGLFIGVNGISVFTKDTAQQAMFTAIPLKSLLLETDAPFLTPPPFRGKINEPAFVTYIAEHHAKARDISVAGVARVTTANATALFAL